MYRSVKTSLANSSNQLVNSHNRLTARLQAPAKMLISRSSSSERLAALALCAAMLALAGRQASCSIVQASNEQQQQLDRQVSLSREQSSIITN